MEFFSIENPATVHPINPGFTISAFNTTEVEDNQSNIHGLALNKMGASIPSVFARLFLFDAAFRQINAYENKNPQQGNEGVLDMNNKLIPTSYHYLVSECLDMLEFLFIYGEQKNFRVVEYNIAIETNKLTKDEYESHTKLAEALNSACDIDALKNMSSIYFFLWKQDGKEYLIGGTSPMTLVYTNPNIKRYNLNLNGGAGNRLFNNSIQTPLHKRSDAFKNFLYNFRAVKGIGTKMPKLDTYIANSLNNYDFEIKAEIIAAPKLTDCAAIEYKPGTFVSVSGISLYCSHRVFDPKACGYLMKTTATGYTVEDVKGSTVRVKQPLALTTGGLSDANYADNRKWKPTVDVIPNALEEKLSRRMLPGTTYVYPYITIDDILQPRIIRVSGNLRKSNFITGTNENSSYILPIKKEIFRFFNKVDIESMVTLSVDEDSAQDNVTVQIQIPVAAGNIQFERTYTDDSIINCFEPGKSFNLAVFPFYHIKNLPNVDDKNIYEVMLGATPTANNVEEISLKFYKKDCSIINSIRVERTKNANIITSYYKIDETFDMIEVYVDGQGGLIIPKWAQEINEPMAPNNFYFCIDFGTSNTQVAYAEINGAGLLNVDDTKSLDITNNDITNNDVQAVTLSDDNGFSEVPDFETLKDREFIPQYIQKDSPVHFPLPTSVCQVNQALGNLTMFNNVSVGFAYDKELSFGNNNTPTYKYFTNLKWDTDPLSGPRMREFFKEMLWMMKNKSLLNDGKNTIHVVVTYPQSMLKKDVNRIKKAWNDAKDDLKVDALLSFELEGIMPYYSFLTQLDNVGRPYMNLDIGGGTTDILYRDPVHKDTLSLSAHFAANDLWGDGVKTASVPRPPKRNGFITYYLNSPEFQAVRQEMEPKVQAVIKNAETSSDIISYFFGHDNELNFSSAIQNNTKMITLPIMHFAALMTYIAYVIDFDGIEVPNDISFTGMGSKYINLISNDKEDIENIINVIFKTVGEKLTNDNLIASNVKVTFSQNPKLVTAQGGLILNGGAMHIHPDPIIRYGYSQEREDDVLQFGQVAENNNNNQNKFNVSSKKEDALKLFNELFINVVKTYAFIDIITKIYGRIEIDETVSLLRNYSDSSFSMEALKDSEPEMNNVTVEEPVFFWCLRDSLYKASQKLAR